MKANIVKRTVAGMTAVISAASTIPAIGMNSMIAWADETVNQNENQNDNGSQNQNEGQNELEKITIGEKEYYKHPKKDSTCAETGNQEYLEDVNTGDIYLQLASGDLMPQTLEQVTIAKKVHNLTSEWTWTPVDADDLSKGYSKAEVHVKCANCELDKTIEAEISSNVLQEPTHAKEGTMSYTAKAVVDGSQIVTETKFAPIKATGHNWVSKWIWDEENDDYSYAGVKFTCNDCPDSTDESGKTVVFVEAKITKEITPATCEEDGKIVYKAHLDFEGTSYDDEKEKTISKLGHDWQTPTYKWVEDTENPGVYTCTATQTCKNGDHPRTESVTVEGVVTREPTVNTKGEKTYTATFENTAFEQQTKIVEIGTVAPEYNTPEYVWSDDFTTCTATMTCKNGDESNTVTETVDVTKEVTNKPSCTEPGTTTYTAVFQNPAFIKLEFSLDDIDPLGHSYDEPEWSFDKESKTATATFTCTECGDVQTVDATTEFEKITEATCDAPGLAVIHASVEFNGETYTKDEDVVIPATGHNLTINWTWDGITTNEEGKLVQTEDRVYCTAVARCQDCDYDGAFVAQLDRVQVDPTCQAEGAVKFVATVKIDGKEYTDTREFIIAKVDHDFGEASYSWEETEDGFVCTATRKCKNCTETETETVKAAYEVVTEPTVSSTGVGMYTADFENEAFSSQTKNVTIAKVLPEYGDPVYEWSDDLTTVTVTRACLNGNPEDALKATAEVKAEVTKEPSCSEMGETTYTAVFEDGDIFPEATKTVANIPMTDHNYGYPIWNWTPTNDGYEASVIFICQDCGAVESTVAEVTSAEVDGYMVYTANAVVNGQKLGSINKVKIVEENKNPDFTVEPGDKSLTLNWDTVDGAEKYGVCAVQRDGSWKVIAQGTETNYTINNLSAGREYMVCIIAMFDGKWEMNFAKAVTMATLENKVPEVSYTPGDGSAKLTWTEVANAEGYGVVARVNGKWELLGSGKGTSYTVKNLTPGKEYTVAVVARFDGKWNMDYSNAITITPNPSQQSSEYPIVNNIEYNDKYHQFRVHWDSVENAEAYGIAYYSAGKWRAYGDPISPETTTWTSPKLTAGNQYTFAVIAKINGKWDTSKIQNRAVNVTVK